MIPRPMPTAEDVAEAEAFVRETYDNNPQYSQAWLELHRVRLVNDYAADCVMFKRMNQSSRVVSNKGWTTASPQPAGAPSGLSHFVSQAEPLIRRRGAGL